MYTLELELNYRKLVPISECYSDGISNRTDKIFLGNFESRDEAIKQGNIRLKELCDLGLHSADKFTENYAYGLPRLLVTNLCQRKSPIIFMMRIVEVKKPEDLASSIKSAIKSEMEVKSTNQHEEIQ